MTKKLILLAALFLAAATGKCQLKSVGEVPSDLKRTMDELFESDLQRAESYTGSKVKQTQPLKEASYHVGKMMASGRIVYGDPVSRLAARIADTLLKDYPTLRSELRFYTVKSPEVNAFATGQGMVFINAGLMAQVEDEAQLAFIISHEIIHYFRSHVMEKLVGDQKKKHDVDNERDEMNEFLRRHNRSREMESEADSLGIALFYLNSPYDKGVTEGVFDVLQYGALPFDDVPFDTTWFNTPYYKLTGCWLNQVTPISSRDDYDDSRSTHPNILSRRRHCAATLDGHQGGAHFVVVTRNEFMQIRHLARLECIRQELVAGEYSRAFYNSWLMLRDHQDDKTLNRYMAQSLYGIAMSKIYNGTNSVTGDYNKVEGESQQIYYAMRRMSEEEAALTALHTLWQLHRRFPNEEAYITMCDDLMDALHRESKMNFSDFMPTPPAENSAADSAANDANKPMTKYERIKQKRQMQTTRNPLAYALTDLIMTDTLFVHELKNRMEWANTETTASPTTGDSNKAIIIYSPSYWVVDNHDDRLDVERSDRKEHNLTSRILKRSDSFGWKIINFSDEGLHGMTTEEQYNDFVVLNEWINEFWQNKGQFKIRRLIQPEMDELMDRYGASTVSMTAVLNIENLTQSHLGNLVLFPIMPISVYKHFSHTEQTLMETLVVDAREGKVITRETYSYNEADQSALVDAMVYDISAKSLKGEKNPVGMLGLRCAITGGGQLSMAGLQPFDIGTILSINPWVNLEYALSRKLTLTAGWTRQGGFEELNKTTPDLSKDMTTWSLALRFYSHTDFAPLGSYACAGIHMVHFTNMSDNSDGGNTFGLHFGAGRNYVFFERILLNIEARYSYTYGLLDFFKSVGGNDFGGRKYMADAFLANLIVFRLGIGILPF